MPVSEIDPTLVRRLREEVRNDGDVIAGPTALDLEAADAIETLLASLPPDTAQGGEGTGVRVKPLVWLVDDDHMALRAYSPAGTYIITNYPGMPQPSRLQGPMWPERRALDDEQQAKAAAQADYEARILSTLQVQTSEAVGPCDRCTKPVTYDLIVPDEVWARIAPKPVDGWKGGGVLCPECIAGALASPPSQPALREALTDQDWYYLRSILRGLREFRDVLPDTDALSLGGEALSDNIDWLDCFLDAHGRALSEKPNDA
jgi:hypothetical protein